MSGSSTEQPEKVRRGDAASGPENSPWGALPRLRELMQLHPLAICDVALLPLPKSDMKNALKVAWDLAARDAQRAEIEAGFLYLSQFQQGVGPEPIRGDFPETADPAETAALVNRWVPWATLCQEEKWSLWVELVEFKRQRLPKSMANAA